MKLTKKQEGDLAKKIVHITGECMCSPTSKTCIYWKKVDEELGWQTKAIIQEIKKL